MPQGLILESRATLDRDVSSRRSSRARYSDEYYGVCISVCGTVHDHQRSLIQIVQKLLEAGCVRFRQRLELQAERIAPHPADDSLLDVQRPPGVRELDLEADDALSRQRDFRLDTTTAHGQIGNSTLACERVAGEGAPEIDVESRAFSMISHTDTPAGVECNALRTPIREEGLLSSFIGTTGSQLEVEWIGCDRTMLSAETGPGLFGRGEWGYLATSSSCTA